MALTRSEMARMIDHTLLAPEATAEDVARLCAEAGELGAFAVCMSPSMLPLAPGTLPAGVALVVVAGFPSGAHRSAIKAAEAEESVAGGADEVDMVMNLGAACAGRWDVVTADIEAVRATVPSRLLKVILETAVLDDDQIVAACRAAETAWADFVKTSTGFHPRGGASVEAVRLMRSTVGDRLGVKASGGIRTAAAATVMIEAGADRIGASASAAILAGIEAGIE